MRIGSAITRLNIFSTIDHWLRGHAWQDNIIIHGFWRSGTTFLMEQIARMTASRSYFEPLLLKTPSTWPAAYERQNSLELHRLDIPAELKAQPCYYLRPHQNEAGVGTLLDEMMMGKISSKWTRKSRRLENTFSNRITIKLVRGNLLAGYLQHHYASKSIFVLRHPGGIVASMTRKNRKRSRKGGIETGLISESFIQSLLDQEHLVKDYLSPFLRDIDKLNTNDFNRVVLAWAITNYVPLKQIHEGDYTPFFMTYEKFVLDADCRSELTQYLGLEVTEPLDMKYLSINSATVQGNRKDLHPTQRLFSWRKELSADQIKTVYEICSIFGPVLMDQLEAIDNLADESKVEVTA